MTNIKRFSIIAFLSFLILQSCSKKDPIAPKLPPIYHKDGDVAKIMFNRPDGVNIVFLGDGFTKDDLKENGKFDSQVRTLTNFFFNVEPFKQYKNYFNVYQVYAESKVSGAANPNEYILGRTKFDTHFGAGNSRSLVTGNYHVSYEYAAKAVPTNTIALLVMLVNDDRYGGTGGSIATISSHESAEYILLHEAGHTFAGLADEYIDELSSNIFPLDMLPYLPNVDNTSDLTKIKWAHLLEYQAYQRQLGAFEGGFYRAQGIYRPEETSIMKDIYVARFNAPSREAIVRTIYSRMSIPFDLNAFIKEDAKNLQSLSVVSKLQIPALKDDFIEMKQRVINLHKLRHRNVSVK